MSATDLLAVGAGFEDLVFSGLDRLPSGGQEVRTADFVHSVGGAAVVTAVAAARLGLACGILSGLSDMAAARLRAERIDVTNLRLPNEPWAITAALSTRSERSFVSFSGINDILEGRFFDALTGPETRHVHFAFYPHDCGRWEATVSALRAHGITTSWDFGSNEGLLRDRRFPCLLEAVDYVLLEDTEAMLYSRRGTLTAALDVWRVHGRHVIITSGADGSRWVGAGVDLSVPARRVRFDHSTASSDAFNGGVLFGVVRGFPPRLCLRLGNHVAAMATRCPGGIEALPFPRELPKGLAGFVGGPPRRAFQRESGVSPTRSTRSTT